MRPRTIFNQVRLQLFALACNPGNFLRQALLAAILLNAGLPVANAQSAPSKIVTLSDGGRYEFAGVTYGTNQTPEFDPSPLEQYQTNEWSLRVWFRRLGT